MTENQDLVRRVHARVGTTVAGKYRLEAVLGIGGMAAVYAATHRNQAEFAIKMLHPELAVREDVRTRFLREGYAANSVKHPGSVRVVDDDIAEDGAAFLVMELLHGLVVQALWEKRGGRLSTPVALAIVDQLLDVLAAAHAKGIVHRDIKPANLFLTSDGTLKVLDFGIARTREALHGGQFAGQSTGTGMVLGTPAFMAPEQALAKSNEIDAQTDLWAVAATLFTLVSGQLVHRGDNAPQLLVSSATTRARPLSSIAPDVPDVIAGIVDRGLAFEKSARWPSAQAMRQALLQASVSAYGQPSARTLLNNLMASISAAEANGGTEVILPSALEPTPAVVPIAPPSRWPGSGTTSQGVATASTRTSQAPRRSKRRIGRGTVLAIVAAVGAAIGATSWMSMIGSAPAVSSAQPPIVPRVPAAAVAPTSLPTPASEAPAVAPALTATPPLDPQASTSGASSAFSVPGGASRAHASVTRPPPTATHVRPPSSPNCNPPFTIDSAGHRVPKAECL